MAILRREGDIWSAPPGGLPEGIKRPSLKPAIAFLVVVSLGLGGALTLTSMRRSTAVSTADALAEFQASAGEGASSEDAASTPTDRKKKRDAGKRADRRPGSGDGKVTAAAPGGSNASSSTDTDDGGNARAVTNQPQPRNANANSQQQIGRPEDGVYTWQVEGFEQAPGVRRDLPSRGHRVITHQGTSDWQEHHIFSEEREQWMNLSVSEEGVTTRSVRNYVKMGPVEQDKTITYSPPMFVARFPAKVGARWDGSWSGKTSGTYAAATLDHTTLVIEGEELEVWVTEVTMNMRGEVQGQVTVRSWFAPKYRLVVKQAQKMNVESGPSEYRMEWEGQVLSVHPQR